MRILVSNDDGYLAEGLCALVAALRDYAELSVVAPDRNRSGASNSLTLETPLRAHTWKMALFASMVRRRIVCI